MDLYFLDRRRLNHLQLQLKHLTKLITMTDDFILVCNRITDGYYTPGIKAYCQECNNEIWISDSSIKIISEKPKDSVRVLCHYCANPLIAKADNVKLEELTEQQKEELKNILHEKNRNDQ